VNDYDVRAFVEEGELGLDVILNRSGAEGAALNSAL